MYLALFIYVYLVEGNASQYNALLNDVYILYVEDLKIIYKTNIFDCY